MYSHMWSRNGLINECGGGLIQSLDRMNSFETMWLAYKTATTRYFETGSWLGYERSCEGSDPKQIKDIGKDCCQTISIGEYLLMH
jgi:hypothetical protein